MFGLFHRHRYVQQGIVALLQKQVDVETAQVNALVIYLQRYNASYLNLVLCWFTWGVICVGAYGFIWFNTIDDTLRHRQLCLIPGVLGLVHSLWIVVEHIMVVSSAGPLKAAFPYLHFPQHDLVDILFTAVASLWLHVSALGVLLHAAQLVDLPEPELFSWIIIGLLGLALSSWPTMLRWTYMFTDAKHERDLHHRLASKQLEEQRKRLVP